jgi:uncharacterized protein (DUF2235 family)
MLHKCGLLEKGSNNLIPYATRMYRKGKDDVAAGFKTTFSRECKPHFVGVWDTVKSVGLITPRKFPNAVLNPDVKYAYHAVAIDEKRSKFRENLWEEPAAEGQTIKQVWFAGPHGDIGGSSQTADIALLWMVDQARRCGLKVDESEYSRIVQDSTLDHGNPLWPIWWILGWWRRKIPKGSIVHESVFSRMAERADYRPANIPDKDQLVVEPWNRLVQETASS